MKCLKCKDTGWILFKRDAPSPPYIPGQFLEYGVRCDCDDDE